MVLPLKPALPILAIPIGDFHNKICQKRLNAPQQTTWRLHALFDHLVGAAEQREWHREPKRLGGLQVEDQFDLGELLHRQRGGILALENATDIDADLAI